MIADFTSEFWNFYVMALTVYGMGFCMFLLIANTGKRKSGPAELIENHVWDETLREYNNPLPRWWLYLAWITIIFSLVYYVLYPGFGDFKGILGWTSVKQYDEEMAEADKVYGPIFQKFLKQDLLTVAADPEANAMGKRMFLTYCSQCHGSTAQGSKGFPNLTDGEWMWGGDPETIKTTIMEGRMGVMTPFGQVLGAAGVKDAANYVRSLSGLAHDAAAAERGAKVFEENCVVCHGPDAKGSQLVGAPDLTNKVWLYGSAEPTIVETITNGRVNQMPAFKDFLGEAKIHLLAAYVVSLSKNKHNAK